MPQHISVATIDSPEFINLQPLEINPLMASCEIKVLYVGENRNKSYITKEVATEMAKTLRGAPIVGYFKEAKGDFADHGEQVIIDDEGIKFKSLTKPYGFVPPNAEVWFQKFEDQDDFGNTIIREYLMTTGYLWAGQYEECKSVLENGKPHSMELDKKSVQGHWAKPYNQDIEYFIISDAVFKNLCILGEDVEPCFEGSNITTPNISASFSKMDEGFTKTLYNMMQDLKFALEGGQQMDENKVLDQVETVVEEPVVEAAAETEFTATEETKVEETVESAVEEPAPVENSFAKADDKKEDEEKKDETPADDKKSEDKEDSSKEDSKDEEDEDKKKKYSLLESEYEELKTEFTALQEKYNSLLEFKKAAESKEKMELIDTFYMLSEEDKKDVIENITEYTLDEIEAKLAVKCLHNGAFNLENKVEEEAPAVTFNLEDATTEDNAPAWISACRKTRDNR